MEQQTAQPNPNVTPVVKPASIGDESHVRQVLSEYAEAIRSGKIDAIVNFYASDIIAFDLVSPLKTIGKDAYKKSWDEFIASCQFPVGYEFSDLMIKCVDDLAVSYALIHMTGTSKSGENMDCWFRMTDTLKKEGETWKISHEHVSVPVDMKSGKALMDLKPDTPAVTAAH